MNSTSHVKCTMVRVLAIALIGLSSGCGGSGVPFAGDNFALQMVESGAELASALQSLAATGPQGGYQGVPPNAVALRVTIGQIRVVPVHAPPIRLNMPPDTVIDVLDLPASWSLLEQDLPPGEYKKLELIVASAEMEFENTSVESVFVPSGAQTGLKLPIQFTIYEGYNTVLQLDWNTHNSVHCTGNGQWMLQPTALTVTDISQPEAKQPCILFADDFDDGDMDGWTIGLAGGVTWSVQNGVLVATKPSWQSDGGFVVAGDPSWGDYVFEVDATPQDDAVMPEASILFRHIDNNNFYGWYNFGWFNGITRLYSHHQDGEPQKLAQKDNDVGSGGTTYHLRVVVQGSRIQCYRDDTLVFDVVDDSQTHGKIGLVCGQSKHIHFDNVVVRRIGCETP